MNMELIKMLRERTGAGLMECKQTLQTFHNDLDKSTEFLTKKGMSQADKKAGRSTLEGLVQGFVRDNQKMGALVEVNCETDFVAKNTRFTSFVDHILKLIIENEPSTVEELLSINMQDGRTVQENLTTLITTFGENIQIRRFTRYETNSNSIVGSYIHKDYLTEGKLGVLLQISVVQPETLMDPIFQDFMRNLLVHIAASTPKYINREQIPNHVLEKQEAIFREAAEKEGKPAILAEKIAHNRLEKFIKDNCLLDQIYVKDHTKTITNLIDELNEALGAERIHLERFSCFLKGEAL